MGNTVYTAILITKMSKADFHVEVSLNIATDRRGKTEVWHTDDVTTNSDRWKAVMFPHDYMYNVR